MSMSATEGSTPASSRMVEQDFNDKSGDDNEMSFREFKEYAKDKFPDLTREEVQMAFEAGDGTGGATSDGETKTLNLREFEAARGVLSSASRSDVPMEDEAMLAGDIRDRSTLGDDDATALTGPNGEELQTLDREGVDEKAPKEAMYKDDAGNYYTDTGVDTGYDAPSSNNSSDAKTFDKGGDGNLNYSEFKDYAISKGMTDPDVINSAFTDRSNGDHNNQGIAVEDASAIVDTYIGGQYDT